MSKSWAGGSTRHWRRVRKFVLWRDAGKGCRAHADGWCARKSSSPHQCTGAEEDAHHTLGRSVTGDDPRYIVASCHACNLHIGDPTHSKEPACNPVTKW